METISNPVIRGFYPDPSICRVGTDYYLVTSTFEYFPGVPIFHSKDLVNWQCIGHCLTRKEQLDLDGIHCSSGVYAPTLRYHDGTFYMVTTNVGKNWNFFVTATDPTGPWSSPIQLGQKGIDPSFLFDNDGKVYLTTSRNLQSEVDISTGRVLTEPRQIWEGTGGNDVEAPHLYKIRGWYYLLCAEGGTHHGHMVTIARSRSPWGPFESCPKNPILTNRHLSGFPVQTAGHADLFEAHDGSWWLVCLGTRIAKSGFPRVHLLGRETFLVPVEWSDDGWPVVNVDGVLRLQVRGPSLSAHSWPKPAVRDDFAQAQLGNEWVHIRNPISENYSLTERPGWLRLHGNANTLHDLASPTCVLRRQTEFVCRVETLLDFQPSREGEEAGLTVLMNATHHYSLFVYRFAEKRYLTLRFQIGDMTFIRATHELPATGNVRMILQSGDTEYRFSCITDACLEPILLGTGRARYLSTEVAGGFTGMMIGLYASGSGAPCSTAADFDWFEYSITASS